MKECNVQGMNFKFRFLFLDKEDYLEHLCEELNKNGVRLEDVERLYIKEIKSNG